MNDKLGIGHVPTHNHDASTCVACAYDRGFADGLRSGIRSGMGYK